MDKKIKIGIAVILIIILIFIIVKIISGNTNKESKLVKIYNRLMESNQYSFTYQQNSKNKTTMAKNGNDTIVDTIEDKERSTAMVKDGNTYVIRHSEQEYYIYPNSNVEQNILTEAIKEQLEKEFIAGKEKVKGHKYYYEEYKGSTIFATVRNMNEDEITTRFYYDNAGNLTYIKTIIGEENEILKVELSYSADKSLFEIPSNYAENNL